MSQTRTLTFSGTCAARSTLVLSSQRISMPYTLQRIRARFAAGCLGLLSLRVYSSEDPSTPAAGPPSGLSLLATYSQVDYLVGDADTKDLVHQVPVREAGTWLKIYAANTDYYPHAIDVQVTVDLATPESE